MKKMYRSQTSRVIAGICGGLGELYAIDPTLLRLIFLFVMLVTGFFPLVITYIIAWFVLPMK
jgi:phage shock protein C